MQDIYSLGSIGLARLRELPSVYQLLQDEASHHYWCDSCKTTTESYFLKISLTGSRFRCRLPLSSTFSTMSTMARRCLSGWRHCLRSSSWNVSLAISFFVSFTSGLSIGGLWMRMATIFTMRLPTCWTCLFSCSFLRAQSILKNSSSLDRQVR